MIRIQRLALAGLVASAFAAPAAAQTTLSFSTWVPQVHHISIWQENWTKEVEKATNGRVKFNYLPKHPSAPPGTFDAVREGLIDLCYVTASYTPARHILPRMAELPGAGDTSVANSLAYSHMHWKHFQKVGEYNGVHLIGVFTHGPGQMFTKKPIKTLADFKGLKIRSGGGASELVVTALGGSPFFKPAGESYELLKSGVADGIFFPIESIVSFKLETVLTQATLFPGGLYSSSFGFFMNQGKWDKLPQQDKDVIAKLSGEYIARSAGRSWDAADNKGMEAMKKSEIRIVNADAALIKEARALSAPIEAEWIKQATAKGVNAKAVLEEFRAELKKVANEK
jgi:TRAP-type C4-dicarboxylate transport system substrate-binding protein